MATDYDIQLREAFQALRAWLEPDEGDPTRTQCIVLIQGCIQDHEAGLAGGFIPPDANAPDDLPRIEIFRAHQQEPGAADEELAVLAHEAGHWRSWQRGEAPSGAYRENLNHPDRWPDLPAREKEDIYGEEANAWRHGRGLLVEVIGDLPDAFWGFYEQRTEAALARYCGELGLPATRSPRPT